VDRRDAASWLVGPGGGDTPDAQGESYPGARLGRPNEGIGAVAGLGRRVLGICIDWAVALLIANGFLRGLHSFGPLAVLLVMHVLLVGTAGSSLGHRLCGLRVERVRGGLPGPVRALVRTVLLGLVIPALITDADRRGLHDQAAGTVLVRG
jgi:uncharacterized RDD family membrane protein YckC